LHGVEHAVGEYGFLPRVSYMGQCTDYMRAKLEAVARYDVMKERFDLKVMIKATKGLRYQFED
jgi:hypothetical protein